MRVCGLTLASYASLATVEASNFFSFSDGRWLGSRPLLCRVCSLIEGGWVFVGKLGHRAALPDPEDGQKHAELVQDDPEQSWSSPNNNLKLGS